MALKASKELELISNKPPHDEFYALKRGGEELGRWRSYEELTEYQRSLPREEQLGLSVGFVYELSPPRSRRTGVDEAVSDWLPLSEICLGE